MDSSNINSNLEINKNKNEYDRVVTYKNLNSNAQNNATPQISENNVGGGVDGPYVCCFKKNFKIILIVCPIVVITAIILLIIFIPTTTCSSFDKNISGSNGYSICTINSDDSSSNVEENDKLF